MDGQPTYLIEQNAEFYRRVALKADDEILVRACLLLAAAQILRLENAGKVDSQKAINSD